MYKLLESEAKKRKNTRRENRNPRMRLIKQQTPWMISQKIDAGDLTESPELSLGEEVVLKLLLRRVEMGSFMFVCLSFVRFLSLLLLL